MFESYPEVSANDGHSLNGPALKPAASSANSDELRISSKSSGERSPIVPAPACGAAAASIAAAAAHSAKGFCRMTLPLEMPFKNVNHITGQNARFPRST